jgi:hypothetical protein
VSRHGVVHREKISKTRSLAVVVPQKVVLSREPTFRWIVTGKVHERSGGKCVVLNCQYISTAGLPPGGRGLFR